MGRARRQGAAITAAGVAAVALALGATPAAAQPTVKPGPTEHCERAELACVDGVIRRLRATEARLGCDHRAVFATTYRVLTQEIRATLVNEPDFYRHRSWLITQDAVFSNYYFDMLDNDRAGLPVHEAWRIALDTARTGDANAAQDMLLGINAHVQRDMPYVLARVGLVNPRGESRKPDHDAANAILERAYERVVATVARRYDPIVGTINSPAHPLDNVAGLELVRGWRELVWRNAERLLNASTPAEKELVKQSIETNAATTAREIASQPQMPGYRAVRDAHCAARKTR